MPNFMSDDDFEPYSNDYNSDESLSQLPHDGEPLSCQQRYQQEDLGTLAMLKTPRAVTFDLRADSQAAVIPNNSYLLEGNLSPQQIYLHWHHWLNHMS